jgi:hypothetical protein
VIIGEILGNQSNVEFTKESYIEVPITQDTKDFIEEAQRFGGFSSK